MFFCLFVKYYFWTGKKFNCVTKHINQPVLDLSLSWYWDNVIQQISLHLGVALFCCMGEGWWVAINNSYHFRQSSVAFCLICTHRFLLDIWILKSNICHFQLIESTKNLLSFVKLSIKNQMKRKLFNSVFNQIKI